ncbi:hypothetical protein BDA99DRAFT_496808 [Phascolomyces articulosus]|uniref:BZIP domain-containing protein n=1 Tax=Phascolomyces articulosus TaxID=60185 RepID=A0AAD5PIW1_9FUNG|nr:hypothetical protein BDA99DRAFT_496808 [Phascolomyces articulosus]
MVSTFTGSIEQQLTTTTSGTNYSQTESSPDWSIDDSAQELLNEAIASNYRSQDNVSNKQIGSKRKSTNATGKSTEDSSSLSSSGAEKRKNNNKGNNSNTSGPKRAGRRPLEKTVPTDAPLDPKQKRKEQNRAAQRAFRERKERHVSELQERIRQLEEENASHSHLAEENAILKKQLQKLQEENYSLKGTPFTFEFPPKTGIVHEDEFQYRSSSTTSSSCGSLSVTGDKSSTSSSNSEKSSSSESPSMTLDHLSSLEEDEGEQREEEKDLLEQQQFQQQQQQQEQVPEQNQLEQTQQDILDQQTFPSFQNAQELSIDDLLAPFANNTDNFFFNNNNTTTTTNAMLPKDQFAFTDYRVPQSADSFLFQADLPPLFGGDVDLFGLSAPAPNNDNIDPITLTSSNPILSNNPASTSTASSPTSPITPPADNKKSSCQILNKLREAKGQNPKAMEIDRQLKDYCPEFDLDNLCWELKEKAKCSENRFSEKEMGHIIDYFEKKGECKN